MLADIISDVLGAARLDNKARAVELLKESKSRKREAVATMGHSLGATRIAAKHTLLGHFAETTAGLTSVRAAGRLLDAAESDWPVFLKRLEGLRRAIVRTGPDSSSVVNLTGDERCLAAGIKASTELIDALPHSPPPTHETLTQIWKREKVARQLPREDEAFAVQSQVNYVCKGGPVFAPGERAGGSAQVLSHLLSTGYLWDRVRVQGGAYGGFSRFSEASGRLSFLSYRDPNVVSTIEAFDGAAEHLRDLRPADLTQAIIGSVGDLDAPLTPDQKGFVSLQQFVSGETAAHRQLWRDEVLTTSAADARAFAARLDKLKGTGNVVVFGSLSALEDANAALKQRGGVALRLEQAFSDK